MQEELEDFESLHVLRMKYDDFDEWLRDAEKVETEAKFKSGPYEPRQGRPEPFLSRYGPSEVILEYLSDEYVRFAGAQIARVTVTDGTQAQRFLEHAVNTYGGMSGTPLHRKYAFTDMPFLFGETVREGKKIMNLTLGADHPEICWREMYNIYVKELQE